MAVVLYGKGGGGRGGGKGRGVVLWFEVHQAMDSIEGNMVSVLLDIARVGASAWCDYLPTVEPPWAAGSS